MDYLQSSSSDYYYSQINNLRGYGLTPWTIAKKWGIKLVKKLVNYKLTEDEIEGLKELGTYTAWKVFNATGIDEKINERKAISYAIRLYKIEMERDPSYKAFKANEKQFNEFVERNLKPRYKKGE